MQFRILLSLYPNVISNSPWYSPKNLGFSHDMGLELQNLRKKKIRWIWKYYSTVHTEVLLQWMKAIHFHISHLSLIFQSILWLCASIFVLQILERLQLWQLSRLMLMTLLGSSLVCICDCSNNNLNCCREIKISLKISSFQLGLWRGIDSYLQMYKKK